MIETIKQRYRYPSLLLRQLVKTDFQLRYHGSTLGYLWTLIRPLAIFAILYVVFAKFLRVGDAVPFYAVYLLLGIMLWNYFVEVTSGSVEAIVGKGELLRKINFPKYIVVLTGSVSATINLLINSVVLTGFMLFLGADPSLSAVVVVPLLFAELFVFSLGVGFLLSALFVRFRDVQYIWEVVLQGAFYATPILYPLSFVPEAGAKILMLNPIAQIIQDARRVLITPESVTIADVYGNAVARLVPLAIVIVVSITAAIYFRKRSRFFAEEV